MIKENKAPEIKTIQHIDFLTPEKYVLENNVPLYCIRDNSIETVQIDLVFDAGSIQTKKIIALITGGLLFSGTKEKSSDLIEEEIDYLGGFKGVSVQQEEAVVALVGLRENVIAIATIVIDAILHVQFDEKEINQNLQAKKKKMEISLRKVETQAKRTFMAHLFDATPYGELTQLEDYDKVERIDLIQFHQENYVGGLKHISVVGSIEDAALSSLKELGGKFNHKNTVSTDYFYKNTPKKYTIKKKDAVQSAIRIGRLLFNKNHPDFIPFAVLNTVLGGYFGSRLMTTIREEKGYTYGIQSGVAQLQKTGFFYISTEVNARYREATLEAVQEEIKKLQTIPISDEELGLVKNYMVGNLLEQSDGPQAMMERFLAVNKFGLDLSYYNQFLQEIHQVTAEQLMELANTYLNWEDFTIVTAG